MSTVAFLWQQTKVSYLRQPFQSYDFQTNCVTKNFNHPPFLIAHLFSALTIGSINLILMENETNFGKRLIQSDASLHFVARCVTLSQPIAKTQPSNCDNFLYKVQQVYQASKSVISFPFQATFKACRHAVANSIYLQRLEVEYSKLFVKQIPVEWTYRLISFHGESLWQGDFHSASQLEQM